MGFIKWLILLPFKIIWGILKLLGKIVGGTKVESGSWRH